MAYNAAVQILPGDILTSDSSTSITHRYPYYLTVGQLGANNFTAALNYNPALTVTNSYPAQSWTACYRFSPNGRYLAYASTTTASLTVVGVTIVDLQDNTVTVIPSVGIVFQLYFSADSSTILVSSNVTPFIFAIDCVTKTTKGTVTGGPTLTANSLRGYAYGSLIYFVNAGTGATGEIYSYNPATNTCSLVVSHAWQFASICIDSRGYAWCPSGSTGTGRGLIVYDLNSIGTTPATLTTLNFFGAGANLSEMSSNGIYFVSTGSSLRAAKVTYGANVTATTIAAISPTVAQGLSAWQPGIEWCMRDNVLFFITNTNVYPNRSYNLGICDVSAYTSGNVTTSLMPGANTAGGSFTVHPGFTHRKFAGHVTDNTNAPVARQIEVFERVTGRLIATATSSAVDGSFTIPVYTSAQCVILAKGQGSEVSKIADNVAPVSL